MDFPHEGIDIFSKYNLRREYASLVRFWEFKDEKSGIEGQHFFIKPKGQLADGDLVLEALPKKYYFSRVKDILLPKLNERQQDRILFDSLHKQVALFFIQAKLGQEIIDGGSHNLGYDTKGNLKCYDADSRALEFDGFKKKLGDFLNSVQDKNSLLQKFFSFMQGVTGTQDNLPEAYHVSLTPEQASSLSQWKADLSQANHLEDVQELLSKIHADSGFWQSKAQPAQIKFDLQIASSPKKVPFDRGDMEASYSKIKETWIANLRSRDHKL